MEMEMEMQERQRQPVVVGAVMIIDGYSGSMEARYLTIVIK
jgi:hypothetical protein